MDHKNKTWEIPHPSLLSVKANSYDNLKWFVSTNGPYLTQFSYAIHKEIEKLEKIGAWEKVKQATWMNTLKKTWVFKLKAF